MPTPRNDFEPSPETKLINLFQENKGGQLHVLVGYTSVWGLAWLGKHTKDFTEITLTVGDLKEQTFDNATEENRAEAISFLERTEVYVYNCDWYLGKSERQLHSKVFFCESSLGMPSVLVGSSNLTRRGLKSHTAGGDIDTLITPASNDIKKIRQQICFVEDIADGAKIQLLETIKAKQTVKNKGNKHKQENSNIVDLPIPKSPKPYDYKNSSASESIPSNLSFWKRWKYFKNNVPKV